jgi:hypothetical protein
MKRAGPVITLLVLAAGVTGCGDTGITEQELRDARHEAFANGRQAGYADGARVGQRRAGKRIAAVRDQAFRRGVDYVLHGLDVQPGQDYAIAFKQTRRGYLFVKDSLAMKPGKTYECPPQSPYCTVADSATAVPSTTLEPAPADPCDPSYPNVCLDATAIDYDCAGSDQDGPEYVEGPVRILGSDHFQLDGHPRDGIGCENR